MTSEQGNSIARDVEETLGFAKDVHIRVDYEISEPLLSTQGKTYDELILTLSDFSAEETSYDFIESVIYGYVEENKKLFASTLVYFDYKKGESSVL